jgi:type I restriction enzyme S subunit
LGLNSDWKECVLSDIYEFTSGLSKNSKEFGFGSPFLSFKTVFNNYFIPSKLNELVNTTQTEQEKCSIKKGDVFLTRTSETMNELGMSCVSLKDYPHATFNGFTKRLRPKKTGIIYPLFAGYYFRSGFFRNAINSMAIMTTRASLNNEILSKLPILLPSYETQEKIGEILFNIDKKIKTNEKINKNLEHIVEIFFQENIINYWQNESPKDWKIANLSELITITSGKRPKIREEKENEEFSVPVIGASSIMAYTNEFIYNEPLILIGRVGTLGIVQRINFKSFPSDNTLVIKSKYYEYVFQILKKINYGMLNVGSTQPLITQTSIKDFEVIIPPENILTNFEEFSKTIYHEIYKNQIENKRLIELRDVLLLKLISGQIDVLNVKI